MEPFRLACASGPDFEIESLETEHELVVVVRRGSMRLRLTASTAYKLGGLLIVCASGVRRVLTGQADIEEAARLAREEREAEIAEIERWRPICESALEHPRSEDDVEPRAAE